MALTKEAYRALEDIVGARYLTEESAVLEGYCFVWGNEMFFGDRFSPRPHAVILPGSTEEVQAIVKLCNRYAIEYKAHASGFCSAALAGPKGFLSIELRRMNRILEIDEKNMFAVIEPCVTAGELLLEAMKKGLRSYSGSSPTSSIVASATSYIGLSSSQISAGYGGRNPLGVEWVLPDGEILRLGSLGTGAGWFTGDGPGPSLRGIMRGHTGPSGGLGVITKAAVKLVPWYGPAKMETKGKPPSYTVDVPENFRVFTLIFPSREKLYEAFGLINEEAIAFACSRRGPFTMVAGMTGSNKEAWEIWKEGYFQKKCANSLALIMDASSRREMDYKEKVLEKILERTEGEMFPENAHGQSARFVHALTGQGGVKGVFRATGSFSTGANADEALVAMLKANEMGYEVKQTFGKRGVVLDDDDPTWLTATEENTSGAHQEFAVRYDPLDPQSIKGAAEIEAILGKLWLEKNIDIASFAGAFGLLAYGGKIHEMAGPKCLDYHIWMRKIKNAFDPNCVSESSYYIKPEEETSPQK